MGKEIKTTILINASIEKVWSILINFSNYSKWNPFIKSIKGQFKVGNKIEVRIEPPGAKAMTFKPIVITYQENKEMSWQGKLMFTGIFDGEHKFRLIDSGNGTTTLIQSEIFKGLLVPLFGKIIETNTKNGFEAMNKKLKEVAEQN